MTDDPFRRVAYVDTLDYWVEMVFRLKAELARAGPGGNEEARKRVEALNGDLKMAQIKVDDMLRTLKAKAHYRAVTSVRA